MSDVMIYIREIQWQWNLYIHLGEKNYLFLIFYSYTRFCPQDVLRGVLARTLPAPTLTRIFFATEFTRHLDRSGYIRFRRWRFYAEEGLARQRVQVSFYTSTLKIEYQDTELAFYTLKWEEDNKHITRVKKSASHRDWLSVASIETVDARS
ncbi:MAG: hypothetical protein H0U76_13395 [Ktedonobacteraceae bacterium]|nr:hypothetical protein [Ktedonobacteraceae bacterium]